MNQTTYTPLGRAIAASLLLHAAVFAFGAQLLGVLPKIARPVEPTLHVRLAAVELVQPAPAPQPELRMPEDTPAVPAPAVKRAVRSPQKHLTRPVQAPRNAAPGLQMLSGAAARRANEQIARELFYPVEAVERGLEGEVLVLLFLDAGGNAIAARIETSSGHALLDQAAVRAARTLKSLPADAPREALVPVRFRLR